MSYKILYINIVIYIFKYFDLTTLWTLKTL